VCGERAAQLAHFAAHVDQQFVSLSAPSPRIACTSNSSRRCSIRSNVAVYEPSTHSSNAARKLGAVERARIAGAGNASGELVQNRDLTIVSGDHPVLADDTLNGVQLAFLVFARRIRRDVV
jgi:hypothetical protein